MTTLTAVPYPYTATARTNYATNPRVANDLTGWVGTAGIAGAGSLFRVATTATQEPVPESKHHASWVQSTATIIDVPTVRHGALAVTAGIRYYASAYVRTRDARSYQAAISWRNASNVELSVSYGTAVAVPVGSGWTRVHVTAIAPAGATQAYAGVQPSAAGFVAGAWFDVAALLMEAATELGAYFDGSSSAEGTVGLRYAWAGTAHASVSTATTRTPTAAATTATVLAVDAWDASREAVLSVHRLIGVAEPAIVVTAPPSSLRSGTLVVLVATRQAADVVERILRAGVARLDDQAVPMYLRARTIRTTPTTYRQARWQVTADYQETAGGVDW